MRKKTKSFALTLTTRVRAAMLLIAMLCCATGAWADELTVYEDGEAGSSNVPVEGYWADSYQKCEFIIPQAELTAMTGNAILSMTFHLSSPASAAWGGNFKVFMQEVSETTISAYYGMDDATLVFEGPLDGTGSTMTLDFDAPYNYNGGNLLIGVYQTVKGSYKSATFIGAEVTGASIQGHNSNSLDQVTANQKDFIPKTTFTYGTPPAVTKPMNVAVNYTGGLTAEVTWTSDEPNFDIDVNGTITENVESPYSLTDLELSTTYTIKVRAKNGNGESEWAGPISFTTDDCMPEDQTVINYVLSDSYGDGWNGNAIYVCDMDYNVIETLTIGSGSSATGTLRLCGDYLQFIWLTNQSSNGYPEENSWLFTDAEGHELFSATSGADHEDYEVLYVVDKSPCKRPSNLAASEVGPHSAVLSWTENGTATQWKIGFLDGDDNITSSVDANSNPFTLTGLNAETTYKVVVWAVDGGLESSLSNSVSFTTTIAAPAPTDLSFTLYPTKAEASWSGFAESYDIQYAPLPAEGFGEGWLQYDNNTHYTSIGSSTAGDLTWGVKYPGSMATGNKLTKVSFYENSNYTTETTVHINIYSGGDNAPGTLVHTEDVTGLGETGFHEVTFASPVAITPGKPLWITLTVNGTYVMVACQVNNYDNQWWNTSGSWANMGEDNANLAGYGWMIRGYFESDPSDITWTTDNTTETSYNITGLAPETTYLVQVRGDYGSDGISNWATSAFTTLADNTTPINLTADVTTTTATLSWADYQNSYNVQYRKAAQITDTFFFDDFENGLDQWTITVGEEETETHPDAGIWYTINPTSGLSFESHSGTDCASSWSWNSSAYKADNWLITPQVTFGKTLKFWVRTNPKYPDSYEVLLSTGSNATTDFTVTLQAMAPAPTDAKWNEVTIDLTAYAGQQGYIAIHHVDYDANYLVIDDFGIYNMIDEGSWISATADEATLTLTGLTPGTDYEWQVQGNLTEGTTAWSEVASFTTVANIELANDATNNSTIIAANASKVADVTLSGRTLYKDNQWNTICLPFDVDLTDTECPLYGATAKTLTNAEMNVTNVTLTFGDAVTTLTAGTPYIIKWAEGENIVNPVFNGVTIKNSTPEEISLAGGQVKFIGNYNAFDIAAEDYENTFYMTAESQLKHTNTARTLKSCRAYFKFSDAVLAAREFTLDFGDGETTTGVSDAVRLNDNEEINNWYTVNGMKLDKKPTAKGVYIRNGRKVVIK